MAEERIQETVGFNKSRAFRIRMSEDSMSAWVRQEPLPDGSVPSAEDLRNALREVGIQQGIQTEQLNKIVTGRLYYTEYEVAKGRPAIDGVDGAYEFLVDTHAKAKPVELPDGTVDYTNMELFVPVTKGQLLVKYHPATSGCFGFMITGKLINPKRGKDLPPLRGKGFELSEDKTEYRAAYDGCIDYRNGELTISRLFTVDGDLDMTVGNIHFSGDVEIKGDVARGMLIEAGGTVVIGGHVGAATIEAGDDVILKGGMQGDGSGKIKAGGRVEGKFIESASVACGGDFTANYVLNCKLNVMGKVHVSGREGAIIGGSVQGMLGINAAQIGNEAQLSTMLIAGPGDEINDKLIELKKTLRKTDEEISILQKGKQQIENASPMVQERNRLLYDKAVQALAMKQAEREEALAQERLLSEQLLESQNAKIVVRGTVYPGVMAQIALKKVAIDQLLNNVCMLYMDERAVVMQNF